MKLSISQMRAAGLSDSQIVRVMEEAQAEQREKERIKKQNQRARPRDGGDKRDAVFDNIDLFGIEDGTAKAGTILALKKESKEVRKKESKRYALSQNWAPSEADLTYARSKGFSERRIAQEAERFHNYWLANGRPMKDWAACWRNWITSKYQQPNGGRPQSLKERNREILDAFNDACDRATANHRGGEAANHQVDLLLPVIKPR